MAKQIGIYKITSPSNKVYIGQSVNIKTRFLKYKSLNCKDQIRLYNSLKKYGFDNHVFEIIEECSIDLLNKRERYWQDFYNVINDDVGLNCILTNTKNKKKILSEETKDKISKSNKGKKHSDETRIKMSLSNNNRKHTFETKEKFKNKIFSKETKILLSKTNWKRKVVIDLNTGVFYESAKELSDLINIKKSTLTARLSGKNINNSQYKYA